MGIRASLDDPVFTDGICKLPGFGVLGIAEVDVIELFLGTAGIQFLMESYFLPVPETQASPIRDGHIAVPNCDDHCAFFFGGCSRRSTSGPLFDMGFIRAESQRLHCQ